MQVYCLRCKQKINPQNPYLSQTANGRTRLCADCPQCGGKCSQFVSQKGGSIVNRFINNLPFELHMVGQADTGKIRRHNFTGPGTKLNKRLDSQGRPVPGSEPINDIDRGAYAHDLCYLQNRDTKTRVSLCDPPLQQLAKEVQQNPQATYIQRGNAKIVETAMATKRRFGLGVRR